MRWSGGQPRPSFFLIIFDRQDSRANLPFQCLLARKGTSPHIHLLRWSGGRDIKVEDIHRQSERGTGVGNLSGRGKIQPSSARCTSATRPRDERAQNLNEKREQRFDLTTHIHDPRNMPLHRRTAQQQIDLIVIIAKAPQILNDPQGGLPIRHGGIHVVLLAVLVDAEALEGEVAAGSKLRFHGALLEDGGFDAEVGQAVFHDAEFEGDDAGHFDGAAEGDFAVAL